MDAEKPKKKKQPKDKSVTSSEKLKKKKRPKEEPLTPLEKPKKKKRKKKIRTKEPVNKKPIVKKVFIGALIVLFSIVGFKKMQESSQNKAISKGYAIALSALDKIQLRCTVLWSEIGIDKACTQTLGEMAIGKLKKDVEITVIESRSHRFTAQAKFKGSNKVFQVNKKGKLFLNADGCLAEVRILNPTVEMIEKLESECKPPA